MLCSELGTNTAERERRLTTYRDHFSTLGYQSLSAVLVDITSDGFDVKFAGGLGVGEDALNDGATLFARGTKDDDEDCWCICVLR